MREKQKTGRETARRKTKITDRTSDTDVPAKPDPAGKSPPGKHVQDAEEAVSYNTSILPETGKVNCRGWGNDRFLWGCVYYFTIIAYKTPL